MASLDRLATELICHILEYLEPPAIHSLALVSRRLAGIATETLRFCRKYHAISDQQPATVPFLLRDILQGSARAARRVRSIEIYGTRHDWSQWNDANPYNLIFPEGHVALPAADAPTQGYGPGFFDETELAGFYHMLVDDLSMDPEEAEELQARIAEGYDTVLKVLLIALCPRLKAVRLVRRTDGRHRQGADERYVAKSPQRPVLFPPDQHASQTDIGEIDTHKLLAAAIKAVFATAEKNWPPGFLSLEEVALGVKSRSISEWGDATVRNSAPIGTPRASRYFCLPNLKNIYIHGLTGLVTRDGCGPTRGCSSVENIFLDNPNNPGLSDLGAMFRSSDQTLRSIIFHRGSVARSFDLDRIFDITEFIRPLPRPDRRFTIRSPETLLFCSTAYHACHGDRSTICHGGRSACYRRNQSTMYRAAEINVPVAVVHIDDIWSHFDTYFNRTPRIGQEVQIEGFKESLPRSCAVTVFNGTVDEKYEPMIDQALARFIREEVVGDWSDEDEDEDDYDCGYSVDDYGDDDYCDDYEYDDSADDGDGDGEDDGDEDGEDEEAEGDNEDEGKDDGREQGNNDDYRRPEMAFYLTSLDDYPAERTYRWWSKTIAAGKRYGIKVHTRTTKPPKGNDYGFHVQWPEGISDNVLETSPWHKHPSLPKVYFKPHVGFVEDCEHCGQCETCLLCYPPEVWARIKKKEDKEAEKGNKTKVSLRVQSRNRELASRFLLRR